MTGQFAKITSEQVTELIDLANALLSENRLLESQVGALKYEHELSTEIRWAGNRQYE